MISFVFEVYDYVATTPMDVAKMRYVQDKTIAGARSADRNKDAESE